MKIAITLFGLLNGIYMLLNGKYIGPEKPGIWSFIFSKLGINVFQLGPLFILQGVLWLLWVYSLWTNQSWAYGLGTIISVATLWYLPVGTIFSLIILCFLLFNKAKLGL